MKAFEIKELLNTTALDDNIQRLICKEDVCQEKKRYQQLLDKAYDMFGDLDYHIFSAPGRTEVGGNHTDHQQGRVLAAPVNMDMVAVCAKCEDVIEVISEGFTIKPIYLNDLEYKEEEKFTSEAIIRGIVARFKMLNYNVGGFKAYCNSSVLKGSGISSSAAFEVLIGTILSHLYNENRVDSVEIAKIGQWSENNYFKKPCGLLDQMACSVGGFITIDFKDKEKPVVEKVNFDFKQSGLTLCLVDTKGDHADLSDEYGLMPKEMKEVAALFGKEVMSEVTMKEFLNHLSMIKGKVSDRAILRAYHFLNETERVVKQVAALNANDIETFKKLIIESGKSSYMYLQNVYSTHDVTHQNLSVALAIAEEILKDDGAYRVHGGGLAGTIQAFVPQDKLHVFIKAMDALFGEGSTFVLSVRSVGGYQLL